mgnify:CR=1 FL=1
MFAGFKNSAGLFPSIYRWTYTTQAWDYWGYPTVARLVGAVGASYDFQTPGVYGYFAWLSGETSSNPRKDISIARYSAASTYTNYTWATGGFTRLQGVSIAHDPRTDVEVLGFRDDDGAVLVSAFNGNTGLFHASSSAGGYSGDGPTVTCGPASITRNCIVVWADAATSAGTTLRTLRWRHFSVGTSASHLITFSTSLVSQGYIQFGPPSISYMGPSGDICAFQLTWKNPGSTQYTACKTTAETTLWTNGQSHSVGAGRRINSPRMGSSFEASEQLNTWKAY